MAPLSSACPDRATERARPFDRSPARFTRLAVLAALLALPPAAADAPPDARKSGDHPLDPLTAVELRTVIEVLRGEGHVGDDSLFPLLTLDEPDKARVLARKPGDPAERRAFAIVKNGRRTFEAVVDLAAARTVSWREVPDVQPAMLLTEEWEAAQEVVRAHPGWRQAIGERGIDDLDAVVAVPLVAGDFGDPREHGRRLPRLVRVVSFDSRGVANFWGRPIEGLLAVVDIDEREVVELVDTGAVPIPDGEVDFDPESAGPPRAAPNPIALEQPAGASYELDGHFVHWQKWSFHWRIDPRLGPVVSLVRYGDGEAGQGRSILYQGSLSEMFVPYTDPGPTWYFRAYLDAGEYGIGKLLSRLEPGLDCPGYAAFFHPLLVDDWGNAYVRPRAACLFERYAGDVAWRHFESETGRTEARRRTELVLRTVPTLGNYDYVLDWVFRQDGSIAVSVGATGVPQVKAVASRDLSAESSAADTDHGRLVAERTVAVHHDHFFSFRLDLDVDGPANSLLVERLQTRRLEGDGPRDSTWTVEGRTVATEREARLRIDLERPALWRVVNPASRGPLGYPVSYQLAPGINALPLFGPESWLQRRAGFTEYHLWATPYERSERYAAGLYVNQGGRSPQSRPSRGDDGLAAWTSRDRPIRDTDIVLWYTLGMHHVVRAEDWPVLPTTWRGFELRPFDFFDRNPALDLPDPRQRGS